MLEKFGADLVEFNGILLRLVEENAVGPSLIMVLALVPFF